MAGEKWIHQRMLKAIQSGEQLPVGRRRDPEWEHNAAVVDDLLHDGLTRGPNQSPRDGTGARFSTDGICPTEAGRRRFLGVEAGRPPPAAGGRSVSKRGYSQRVRQVSVFGMTTP